MSSKSMTIVLAKNPQYNGRPWPARICDEDEVKDYLKKGKKKGNPGDVLVVFLCDKGHNRWAWTSFTDVEPYISSRFNDTFIERCIKNTQYFLLKNFNNQISGRGKFPAENWAIALLSRQKIDKKDEMVDESNANWKENNSYNESADGEKVVVNDFAIHWLNCQAHQFYEDELESPWQCEGCKKFTLKCHCKEGFIAYLKTNHQRISQFDALRCPEKNCTACEPPGAFIFASEWEGGRRLLNTITVSKSLSGKNKGNANQSSNVNASQHSQRQTESSKNGETNKMPQVSSDKEKYRSKDEEIKDKESLELLSRQDQIFDLNILQKVNWKPYWHRKYVESSQTRLMQRYLSDGSKIVALLYIVTAGEYGFKFNKSNELVLVPELKSEVMSLNPFSSVSKFEEIIQKSHAVQLSQKFSMPLANSMNYSPQFKLRASAKAQKKRFKGVYLDQKGNSKIYAAIVTKNGKDDLVLGTFDNELDAAVAYDDHIKKQFPTSKKRVNFPNKESLAAAKAKQKVDTADNSRLQEENSTSQATDSQKKIPSTDPLHASGRKTLNSVSRQLLEFSEIPLKNEAALHKIETQLPGYELAYVVSKFNLNSNVRESFAESVHGLLRIQFCEALKNVFGKSDLCSSNENLHSIILNEKIWSAHRAATAYINYLDLLDKENKLDDICDAFKGCPLILMLRLQWQQALSYLTRLALSKSLMFGGDSNSIKVLSGALCKGKTFLLTSYECIQHRVKKGKMESPGRMREALFAFLYTKSILSDAIEISIGVDQKWKALATPHRLLRYGHEGGYLARLHYQCKNFSAEEDETGTGHLSDCPLSSSDEGSSSSDEEIKKKVRYTTNEKICNEDDNQKCRQPDTVGCKKSWDAAVTSVASVLQAIDAVLTGDRSIRNAFCAVRPPGHHAGSDLHAMRAATNGFCILNNVAIGAMYAHYYRKISRVCVIDFDVHHGNGTEDLLCRTRNPAFFYASVHAYSNNSQQIVFPCTGGSDEPDFFVEKNLLNIPLKPPITARSFHRAVRTIIDALEKFRPEFMLLSAGFDAHTTDPNSLGLLTAADFYECTRILAAAAERMCGGRIVSVLEGGYAVEENFLQSERNQQHSGSMEHKETLSDSIQAHIQALAEASWGFF